MHSDDCRRLRVLVLVYACASAALYCSLMPLWEGFDEIYHYAYVQHMATTGTFPVIGRTRLSQELWSSLDFVPVSHYIQPYLERPSISFADYFRQTPEQRASSRRSVDSLDPAWRNQTSPRTTYESMQAPLTYLLLAPADALLASVPLTTRVLVLRLLLSLLTMVLLWTGLRIYTNRLGLRAGLQAACMFVVFCCQMIYAETCRIGNDALIVPWLLFFLVAVADSIERPSPWRTAWTAFLLGAGLLIKSSVLFFVPLVLAAPAVLLFQRRVSARLALIQAGVALTLSGAIAGPWYLRNVLLYHNLTATVESTSGVGLKELLHAAILLPWHRSFMDMAHSGLWTGNNSFTTFSSSTLNLVIALLALALFIYGVRALWSPLEFITIAAILLYCAGIVLISLSFFHSSQGKVIAAMPWYLQIPLPPMIALTFVGLARSASVGRWTAIPTVLLWAYVAGVSWVGKLVPLYGGLPDVRARPGDLLQWYWTGSAQRNSVLSMLCPGSLPVIYSLLSVMLVVLVVLALRLSVAVHRQLKRSVVLGTAGLQREIW